MGAELGHSDSEASTGGFQCWTPPPPRVDRKLTMKYTMENRPRIRMDEICAHLTKNYYRLRQKFPLILDSVQQIRYDVNKEKVP